MALSALVNLALLTSRFSLLLSVFVCMLALLARVAASSYMPYRQERFPEGFTSPQTRDSVSAYSEEGRLRCLMLLFTFFHL